MIRIADVESESIVDGPGFRFTVFTQGCPHRCPGCHNPQTHSFEGGTQVSAEQLYAFVGKSPLHTGVTLSGGEPFSQARELIPFATLAHKDGYNIWAYSGYRYEVLMGEDAPDGSAELLALCDVLVDGPFIEDEQSYDLKWKGSANQRVIDLVATREAGELVSYT